MQVMFFFSTGGGLSGGASPETHDAVSWNDGSRYKYAETVKIQRVCY